MPDDTVKLEGDEAAPAVWPRVVKLRRPIEFGSEYIDELSFRRGRLGDIKGISVDGVPSAELLMLIASRLCGRPLKVIEMLDVDDTPEVLEIAVSFFGACLEGGRMR